LATLARAMAIACTEFEHKVDKGGRPYAEHCMVVAEGVRHLGDEYMIVGWLHDLVEDTCWTLEMLADEGFSEAVIKSISIMTHSDDDDYLTVYIKEVSTDKMASAVKKSDLTHNMDIKRLKGLRKKDFDRLEKYARAYTYLS